MEIGCPLPNELPRISVITVTLNDLVGLELMATSLAEQNYRHIEHIIVDGGSTDGTVEWLANRAPSENVFGLRSRMRASLMR